MKLNPKCIKLLGVQLNCDAKIWGWGVGLTTTSDYISMGESFQESYWIQDF